MNAIVSATLIVLLLLSGATTAVAAPPSVPTDLAAKFVDTTQLDPAGGPVPVAFAVVGFVTVTWKAGIPATQTYFVLEHAPAAIGPFEEVRHLAGPLTGTNYLDRGWSTPTTCYRVSAVNADGASAPSAVVCVSVP